MEIYCENTKPPNTAAVVSGIYTVQQRLHIIVLDNYVAFETKT